MTTILPYALSGVLSIIPALSVFSGQALAPLLALFLLLLFAAYPESVKKLVPLSHSTVSLIISGFLLWGLISCSWAPNGAAALTLWAKLVFLVMGSVLAIRLFEEHPLPCPPMLLPTSLVMGLLVVLEERFSHGLLITFLQQLLGNASYEYALTELNRAATVLALFIWPALVPLIRKGRLLPAVLLVLLTVVVIISLKSLSAVMGVGAGMVVFLLVFRLQGRALTWLLVATFIAIILLPFVMYLQDPAALAAHFPHLPESARHRLYIWDFASHKAMLHPWLGWGFNTSRVIPILPEDMLWGGNSPLPLHPHNSILQLWLELGIPGVLLFAGLIAALGSHIRIYAADRAYMAACTASLMAYFIIGLTAFGIWQEWWIASACLVGIGLFNVRKEV